jgi:hypothetical protein
MHANLASATILVLHATHGRAGIGTTKYKEAPVALASCQLALALVSRRRGLLAFSALFHTSPSTGLYLDWT